MLKMVEIIEKNGTQFQGKGKYGDFEYMIKSGDYEDCLFIFNDDEYRNKWKRATKGNSIIRKYNKYANPEKPRAVGVVTGTRNKGYDEMNYINKAKIDVCFEEVKEILKTHKYKKVYYSAKSPNGSLATGIFSVHEDIINYITEKIHEL